MAMTGIQIFKLLPKTNCKDCGSPTCLAFAMALASGKAELDACPHVSEEAKAQLAESSAPPIRAVTIGTGDKALKVGGELVLYRHEKTFYNPTGLGVVVSDAMSDDEVSRKVEAADKLEYERVGLMLRPDLVAVKCESGDPAKFEALVKKVMGMTSQNLIIMSDNMDALKAGATAAKDRKPLIYAATKDNVDAAGELAKETACPLAVKGTSLDEVAELTEKLTKAGLKDLVIDSGARDIKTLLQDQVAIRRLALEKKFAALGFPTITLPCEMTDDPMKEAMYAALMINKYGAHRGPERSQGRESVPLARQPAQHLHRPAASDGHEGRHLRDRKPGRELSGPDHHELLPHLLHRHGGNRVEPGPFVSAHRRHRRAVRHDRLGGRKIRGRRHQHLRQEVRDRRQGQGTQDDHSWPGCRNERRTGGGTARLEDRDRASRGGSHPCLPEGSVGRSCDEAAGERVKAKERSFFRLHEHHGICGLLGEYEMAQHIYLTGENLNVISKTLGPAMKNRDPGPIREMAERETEAGVDFIDLNIGPARKGGAELMEWIVKTVQEVTDLPLFLDTSNVEAIEAGLKVYQPKKGKAIINSIMARPERMEALIPLAGKYGAGMVALLWGPEGMPRDTDERAMFLAELYMAAHRSGCRARGHLRGSDHHPGQRTAGPASSLHGAVPGPGRPRAGLPLHQRPFECLQRGPGTPPADPEPDLPDDADPLRRAGRDRGCL